MGTFRGNQLSSSLDVLHIRKSKKKQMFITQRVQRLRYSLNSTGIQRGNFMVITLVFFFYYICILQDLTIKGTLQNITSVAEV